MKQTIDTMPLETKIGQLLLASIDGPTVDADARDFLRACRIGGVIHFSNNVSDRAQATALNAALRAEIEACTGLPALLGIDHEGGRVMRFRDGVTAFPPAMAVSAAGSPAWAQAVGQAMGAELRAMGYDIDFAPVLDVHAQPANAAIGTRSYGCDPQQVAAYGAAMVRGFAQTGLLSCGKHFPGHGDTAVDSHFGLPCVDKPLDTLRDMELVPYVAAIKAGMPAIMTSHILFPQVEPRRLPATMSPRILQGLLREALGFDGLIISDGMQMHAITKEFGLAQGCVQAIRAGVDLLCIGTAGSGLYPVQRDCYDALLAAAEDGTLPMDRIDDAVSRVLRAKAQLAAAATLAPDWAADAALAQQIADASVTALTPESPVLPGRVLCASETPPAALSGVTEGNWRTPSVAEIAANALQSKHALIEAAMDDVFDGIDSIAVFVQRDTPEMTAFLHRARRTGKPIALVLTGSLYVLHFMPQDLPVLCVYGAVPVSIEAACRALRGSIPALGKLPVQL